MTELEWGELAIKAAIALGGGASGALIGIWKWGRSSATAEQSVKDDYDGKIREVRKEMASHVQKAEDASDLLVAQFKESFDGIRRQHDELKLDIEKRFMLKDDFRDFREEYREDIRDLKALIAAKKQ